MDTLQSPFGELSLSRWSTRKKDLLRAWDAADEYILEHLAANQCLHADIRVLIVNDAFGALSCALQGYEVINWSDSMISHDATKKNIAANHGAYLDDTLKPNYLKSTELPSGHYDLVLIKIPKTMALLEDQLIKLKPCLTEHTQVVAAGMVKHLPKSAFQLFEKYMGPLTTSLAKKKARLLFVKPQPPFLSMDNPYPSCYFDEAVKLTLSNHANVFSRDHLDLGARFFLKQFDQLPKAQKVIDLACGNGVLGIKYQQQYSDASIQFLDESYMAIASARDNYAAAFDNQSAAFKAQDGLAQIADESVDLILCNPPFHQQYVTSEQVAMAFFQHSKRCLQLGGELWIVANRHLDYPAKLKRLFGHCRLVDSDKKFVVLSCKKR